MRGPYIVILGWRPMAQQHGHEDESIYDEYEEAMDPTELVSLCNAQGTPDPW
jgi:hypothetical protein